MIYAHPTSLDQYLKVSQVASEFNLHPMTVRRATNSGALQTARTNGHQRLIKRQWVYDWLGVQPEQEERPRAVLCVCRVSSRGQLTSLEKQRELTQAFAKEHYPTDEIIISERIASGIVMDHPEVIRILDLISNNKIKAIVCTFKDRCTRVAFDYVKHMCQKNNILIHITEDEEIKTPTEELTQDLIAYITSHANRVSGQKCKKLYGIDIEPEHMELIFKDWKRGMSLADLEAKYSHLRNQKDQAYSFTIIYKRIKENLNALELAYGASVKSEVEDFIKARVKYCDDKKQVTYKALYGAYVGFAKEEGIKPLSKPKFSQELDRLGVLARRFINTKGQTAFKGMALA